MTDNGAFFRFMKEQEVIGLEFRSSKFVEYNLLIRGQIEAFGEEEFTFQIGDYY
jgi:hypothetical protein